MSAQRPTGAREYVAAPTRRIVSTSGQTAEVFSPLSGQPLAHVPQSSDDDVAEAVLRAHRAHRAQRAQRTWARTSVDDRAARPLRFHDLVLDRQDEIIDLIVWASGNARKHASDEPLP